MKTGTVFQHDSTQAISLPVEAHFPERVKKVCILVVGQDRILTPVENTWDSFFLQDTAVTEDFMTGHANQEQKKRKRFSDKTSKVKDF